MLNPLNLTLNKDFEKISLIGHAISSPIRLEILRMLTYKNLTVKEISTNIGIPLNTLLTHIAILEKAELVGTQISYTNKGKSKVCYRIIDNFTIALFDPTTDYETASPIDEYVIPIGSFFDFKQLSAPCGMASAEDHIGNDNDLSVFLLPERSKASIIWFTHGFLEYRVPLPEREKLQSLKEIEITLETCSEAPLYNNDYKSDISLSLGGHELGIYTSPGDFGDRRGLLNPDFWPSGLTQYGKFLCYKINNSQTTLNNNFLSFTNLKSLKLGAIEETYLTLRIGVAPDAKHVGGINLFGKHFGDYSQDIIFKYIY